eukprot:91042_1
MKSKHLRQREELFDNDFGARSKLPEYDALQDLNMQQFFDNPHLQKHLWRTGQIDRAGIVIDTKKNKSKLQIIENEFKRAEEMEEKMQQEEEEVRRAVRKQKLNEIEKLRRAKRVLMIKEDRKVKQDLNSATKEALGIISR